MKNGNYGRETDLMMMCLARELLALGQEDLLFDLQSNVQFRHTGRAFNWSRIHNYSKLALLDSTIAQVTCYVFVCCLSD